VSTLAPQLLAARYERQIVQAFRSRRAVSGPAARRLRDLGLKDTEVLRQMVRATIVRKAGPERYFLHEATWAAHGQLSWRVILLIAILTGLVAVSAAVYLAR
jgi:hypothetical protein